MATLTRFSLPIAAAIAIFATALTGCDGGSQTNTGGSGQGGSGGASTGGSGGSGGSDCTAAEVCGDGIDNDCNGEVDDGCTDCKPGDTMACYSGPAGTEGVGQCAPGVQTCGSDGTYGPCEGDSVPGEELCDGVDNDCNGATDDDPTDIGGDCDTGLLGECGPGTYACEAGEITCSPNVTAEAEVCDLLDNDCDGVVDNDPTDAGNPCDTGMLGVCATGTDTCVNGLIECIQDVMAAAELCDGLDNNCDGATDEGDPGGGSGCDTGMLGACAVGVEQCQNGAIACIQTQMPSPETCDAVDNDCNGMVDEGDPGGGAVCNTGLLGECAAGTTSCTAGALVCNQNTMPAPEACDGLDNNCDGATDEGDPGGGVACNTGLQGVCATGTTACTAGAVVCNQDVMASAETCDGMDNNCDGSIDEGNPGGGVSCNTGLQGVCAAGTTTCTAGAVVCNQDVMASAETCDGMDNNCDGSIDEGNPDGGGTCSTGLVGPCAAGTEQCTGGAIVCEPDTQPTAETCDGADNDCDGLVDDGQNALSIYFYEDFSDNGAGWTTAGQWAIGATSASSGQGYGNPDPANDHTSTNDNGVAGVVLGGNVGTALVGQTYITSPVIDTSGATGSLYLSFWRWLNSDYSPYMVNTIQVYNGTAWTTIYQTGGNPGVQDSAWVKQQYDITAYKSATMQVRFGYSRASGAFTVSGWNIDDLVISNSPYPNVYLRDEFSDTSQGWTLGTSWAIGATSVSTGQSYGGPDPANDHTAGANNGVMGVVLGGNAPINHPYYYTTSAVMDTSWDERVDLSLWRWLNSDYSPYMINQIQVYDGAAWQTLYQTGANPGVQDNAWTNVSYNLTAYMNADMQIRIGYTATTGAYTVSSWNVDDLIVTGGTVCQ